MSDTASAFPSPSHSARAAVLSEAVSACKLLTARYVVGFNDVTHVRQTPDLPNHLAWILGHCALTMHRVAGMIDGGGLPVAHFVAGDGFKGSRERGVFDIEAVAYGSRPEERHDRFPKLDRCIDIFNAAADRLASAVAALPDTELDRPIRWGTAEMPLRMLIVRMVFHNGFHTGQIADTRRALGFKPALA